MARICELEGGRVRNQRSIKYIVCVLSFYFAFSVAWATSAQTPYFSQNEAQTPSEYPEGFVPAQLLNHSQLVYPSALLTQKNPPKGRIEVRYLVDTDGSTAKIEVLKSIHPLIDKAAIEAVSKLRYRAASYQGSPARMVLLMALDVQPPIQEVQRMGNPIKETGEKKKEAKNKTSKKPAALRIRGYVREAGDRQPVMGASITAIPAGDLPLGEVEKSQFGKIPKGLSWQMQSSADLEGRFELRGVPVGRARLIILSDGYLRMEYVVEVSATKVLDLEYYQQKDVDYPYQTTVFKDPDEMPESTRRVLPIAELNKIPGTGGDALKSLQNLPGMARSAFGIGRLMIRGTSPGDSQTYFANHPIPRLFHFGGLSSVVNSDVLQEIDYVPGNFDSRYGDAIGGIVNAAPRKGRRDGFHGYVDMDIIDTSLLFEGPVGKGSFILSARRSYIDLLLPIALSGRDVGFIVAPRYWDYQAYLDLPLTWRSLYHASIWFRRSNPPCSNRRRGRSGRCRW